MGEIEIPDIPPSFLLYILNLPILVLLWLMVFSHDLRTGLLLSPGFMLVLVVFPAIALWRKRTRRGVQYLGTHGDSTYDIARDPISDYWGMSKDRWERNMRRLSHRNDEQDDEQDDEQEANRN